MGQERFDLGDNLQQQAQDHSETHLNLLESAGLIERVASKDGEKAAQAQAAEMTPAQKEFVAAQEEFKKAVEGGKNPKEALTEVGPKFEQSIKTADSTFAALEQTMKTEGPKLQEAFDAATAKVEEGQMKFAQAFSAVPEGEREKVEALMNAYMLLDKNDPVKQAINTSLAKYPGLTAAADEVKAAMDDPAIKRVNELSAQFETAMTDRVVTRMGYSKLLDDNGFGDKAWDYMKEAAQIMGIPVPDKKPLPPGTIEAGIHKA